MSQILKTPLRYPGGKSRAVPKLAQFVPDLSNYQVYREPFLGGGSVALWVSQKYPDLRVWVNDLYEPLVNFWKTLQDDGDKLQLKLIELKSRYPDQGSAKGLFLEAKEIINDREKSHLDRAIAFYVANKCSFSGLTESSSFSAQASDSNFSMRGIEKLKFYKHIIRNWTITNYDYAALLDDNRLAFVYLDPPYDIKDNLYGKKGNMHRGFDHDKFAHICDNYVCRQLVSYNATQMIKDRFQDWIAAEFDHTYTMRSVGDYMKDQHERKELVLMNYEM
jgi:DNA adenine methylase Dam